MVGETRDTVYVLVSMVKVVIAGMPETLMPKEAFRLRLDTGDRSIVRDVFVERQSMIHDRDCLQSFAKSSIFVLLILVDGLNGSAFAFACKVGVSCNSSLT